MKLDLLRDLQPYKRTETFTRTTIPAGLLGDRSTKAGDRGLIHVDEGKLRYAGTDPRRASTDVVLMPETASSLIEPTILHRVEPIGTVTFHVEFMRDPQHGGKKIAPTDRGERS